MTSNSALSRPTPGMRLARRWAAGAALIAIAFAGSACSMIDQFNPFGREKYKMEITPDTPASKTYDQGLAETGQRRAGGCGKEIHRSRQAVSKLGLGAEGPADDDLRAITRPATIPAPRPRPSATSRNIRTRPTRLMSCTCRRMPITCKSRIFRAIRRTRRRRSPLSRPWCRNIRSRNMSRTRNTRSTSPRISSPARKCRSGGSISIAATTRRRSTASATCFSTTRRPGMRKKRSIASSRPISAWASPTKRRLRRRCSGTISPTASGTRTPITS